MSDGQDREQDVNSDQRHFFVLSDVGKEPGTERSASRRGTSGSTSSSRRVSRRGNGRFG